MTPVSDPLAVTVKSCGVLAVFAGIDAQTIFEVSINETDATVSL